jgi:hypothetical protein
MADLGDRKRCAQGDARMCARALSGDVKTSRSEPEAAAAAVPVRRAINPGEMGAAEMGLIENGIRLPMTPLAERFHEQCAKRSPKRACAALPS